MDEEDTTEVITGKAHSLLGLLKHLWFSVTMFWDNVVVRLQVFLRGLPKGELIAPYGEHILAGLLILLLVLIIIGIIAWRRRGVTNLGARLHDGRALRKEAKKAMKSGNFVQAGEYLEHAEYYEEAIDCYLQGKSPVRASQIYIKRLRKVDEGIKLLLDYNQYEPAAQAMAAAKRYAEAAQYFKKALKEQHAAEMYEKAGQFNEAGELYASQNMLEEATRCFVKTNNAEQAAKAFGDLFKQVYQANADRMTSDSKAKVEDLAKKAAYYYKSSGGYEEGADILLKANLKIYAAEMLLLAGKKEKAANLFMDAGDQLKAAEIFSDLGNRQRAAEIKGQYYQARGEQKEAMRYFEEAGDFLAAGDYYAHEGDFKRAGDFYHKGGDSRTAAEMYLAGNQPVRAAEVFLQAGDANQAIQILEQAGEEQKLAELLEKSGRSVEAGFLYYKLNVTDKALPLLQRVPATHSRYDEARLNVAGINQMTRNYSEALRIYQEVLPNKPMGPDNIEAFYNWATLYEQTNQLQFALGIYQRIMMLNMQYKDVNLRISNLTQRMSGSVGASPASIPSASAAATDATRMGGGPPGKVGRKEPRRYEIIREIGRGGMGVVYLANDTKLKRQVAYKILPSELKEQPHLVEKFLNEAHFLAQLSHPYIVHLYDAGEQDGEYFIVMEYIEGQNFKELISSNRRVPMNFGMVIFSQLAHALEYAHGKKVVHRDIKTSNIMWTPEKIIKVMDFGLAKILEEARARRTTVAGTPYYMSPEQTLGKQVDHRSDIYSMGVTVYELLTGRVPFKEGDIGYQHVHTEPMSPRELNNQISEGLSKIILHCMAKDVNQRYQSAREVINDLKKLS